MGVSTEFGLQGHVKDFIESIPMVRISPTSQV
mgnify:CR=1 FL=1